MASQEERLRRARRIATSRHLWRGLEASGRFNGHRSSIGYRDTPGDPDQMQS
jgi:hypothetical protein